MSIWFLMSESSSAHVIDIDIPSVYFARRPPWASRRHVWAPDDLITVTPGLYTSAHRLLWLLLLHIHDLSRHHIQSPRSSSGWGNDTPEIWMCFSKNIQPVIETLEWLTRLYQAELCFFFHRCDSLLLGILAACSWAEPQQAGGELGHSL